MSDSMLWCKNCKTEITRAIKERGKHKYCLWCYDKTGRYYLLTENNPQVKPSVEMVGLNWDIDSKRGKALEIIKENDVALNSDEALFLLYLEKYEKQMIIRKPTEQEMKDFVDNITNAHEWGSEILSFDSFRNIIEKFIHKLKIPHTDLTSFQTLRLARQELKREAKRKGLMSIFNPVVEKMREERAEQVKERYREGRL
jgi:anaerobic selenocysteine-containing dehydrogenase